MVNGIHGINGCGWLIIVVNNPYAKRGAGIFTYKTG
jgi:hypothetical protein